MGHSQASKTKWPNHSHLQWRTCLTKKIKKYSVPTIKSNTCLNDGMNVEDASKNPIDQRKYIFWQTFIIDQRPKKLRVCINGIFIEGLLDMGMDVSIISPESWHPNWPLQEVYVQFF